MPKTTQPELKPLPWNPKKQQIYTMYSDISEKQLRKEMHAIIRDRRNMKPGERIKDHRLYHSEFLELVELIGMPKGYAPYPGSDE